MATKDKVANKNSAFGENGIKGSVALLIKEIQSIYLSDSFPWIVGYSGGKDSTATLQLIWLAIAGLPPEQRHKPLHVITTDTLVENPIVAAWVDASLERMREEAVKQDLPFETHKLVPRTERTFWVNLLGRGYPAPHRKFRWCTERMKIEPSNDFIRNEVRSNGEVIVALGTRKAESNIRKLAMENAAKERTRDKLSPNPTLSNCLVYAPIEDWSNDDVWLFLMQFKNPWGYRNKDLLTMYQGASADGECPLVVDTTTPSCGSSRFGCWVCTLVDKDKSMSAMIQNDEEKFWMRPLLEFRDKFAVADGRSQRDFRRMHGGVQIFNGKPVPGPYKQPVREEWLGDLLRAQTWIRKNGPADVKDIKLITLDELREIRRIWVVDKHEIEDSLPRIYEEATGEEFPDSRMTDSLPFEHDELELLRSLCGGNDLQFELARNLIAVENSYRTEVKRSGLFEKLEKTIKKSFYEDEEDATQRALQLSLELEGADEDYAAQEPYIEPLDLQEPMAEETVDQ